jgi:uncharacterized protein
MRIGITGVTGLIGRALAEQCHARGHSVTGFSRTAHASLPHCQNLRQFTLEQMVNLNGLDALVHLAGEPVVGLWTDDKRRRIVASRRDTTRHLVNSLLRTRQGPSVFLTASGTGFYGSRGAELLRENSGRGSGFLSEVAQVWETEAQAAAEHGIRTAQLRTGLVLAKDGGAFPLLRRVFSLGLGGKIGSGRQYLPWIHLSDLVDLYLHALETPTLSGPSNAVAPEEVTNWAFTQALATALHRPAWFPAPAWLLKMTLGDLSSLVLDSQRVCPQQVLASGFSFQFPSLPAAFAELIA